MARDIIGPGELLLPTIDSTMTRSPYSPNPLSGNTRTAASNGDDAKVERRQPDDGEQPVKLADQRRHRYHAGA